MVPLSSRPGARRTPDPQSAADRLTLRSAVGFLIFVEFVSGLVQGYYQPLLAGLGSELRVGAGPLNWFNSVQLLAAAVSVPIFAALGDRYGHRRLLSIAVWSVAVGGGLVVLAPSFPVALVGRVLQGPLGAWIALEIALVRSRATGARANRAIGLLASALTAGALVGALAGGPIEAALGGVRSALAVPVVLSGLCGLVAMFLIPESTTRARRAIDWIGAAGLSVALALVLLGLSEADRLGWTAATGWGGVGSGLLVLCAWVAWERRAAAPLMDVRLLASRSMWPAMVVTLLFGMSLFGNQVPLVTFLAAKPEAHGYGFGLPAPAISLVLAVNILATVAGSVLYAPLAERIRSRGVLPVGMGLIAAGFVGLALLHGTLGTVVAALAVSGLGMGLLLGGLPAYISGVAPPDQVGIASGAYSTVKVLGGSIATAVIGALLSGFIPVGGTAPSVTGYSVVWLTCAGGALLGLLVLVAAWAGRGRRSDAQYGDDLL